MSEQVRDQRRAILLTPAALLLLVVSMWIALRGGMAPPVPAGMEDIPPEQISAAVRGRFFSVLFIVFSSLRVLVPLWLAAAGLGWPLRRLLAPDVKAALVVQLGAGLAALLLLDWLLATAGLLRGVLAWAPVLLGMALLVAQLVQFQRRAAPLAAPPGLLSPALLLVAPSLALLLVACCCPPATLWAVEAFGYDVTSYHLQLPREWLEMGRMAGLRHNVYSFFPSLGEVGYLHAGALAGSMYEGLYAAQLLHASAALLAAAAVASILTPLSPLAAWSAAAVMLATPWTLITGSLAYNEMFALAFGAVALRVALDPAGTNARGAVLIGILLGAATLVKLTAGPMLAVPVALVLLSRWRLPAEEAPPFLPSPLGEGGSADRKSNPSFRAALTATAIAAIAGTLTLAPYLVRNAAQTGNPVFPFAARLLGSGHWTPELVQRWEHGHAVVERLPGGETKPADWPYRLAALHQHWTGNTGYGAVGGAARQRGPAEIESRNVARFGQERGVSLLWLAALLGGSLMWTHKPLRPLAAAMALLLAVQLIFWLTGTHLQSRFLIPTLIPGGVLIGGGVHAINSLARRIWPGAVATTALVAALVVISFSVFFTQTIAGAQPWQIVDSLPTLEQLESAKPGEVLGGDHPLNHLPRGSHVYLVADNSRLLYIRRPMTYSSAFDANHLGQFIREQQHDLAATTAAMRRAGWTHVWVHWSELERLHATYGFDRDVTPERINALAEQGWRKLHEMSTSDGAPIVTLYRLPL